MSRNSGDNKSLFLKLKSKMGLHHVVLITPKTSPEKPKLTVVEMQRLPDIAKKDCKEEVCCLEWRVHNGRKKSYEMFKTDTDKLIIVVFRYRNSLYIEDNEVHVKLSD